MAISINKNTPEWEEHHIQINNKCLQVRYCRTLWVIITKRWCWFNFLLPLGMRILTCLMWGFAVFSLLYHFKWSTLGFWTVGLTKQAIWRGHLEVRDILMDIFMTFYGLMAWTHIMIVGLILKMIWPKQLFGPSWTVSLYQCFNSVSFPFPFELQYM